jgi:anti-anti-sigma factor
MATTSMRTDTIGGRTPRAQGLDGAPPLAVTTIDVPRGVVVRLEGAARFDTVDRLQFNLLRLVVRRVPLTVLDLSGLTLLSSLAMGALVSLRRDLARWGGRVRIAGASRSVYESLEAAGLTLLFEFFGTVEEALEP